MPRPFHHTLSFIPSHSWSISTLDRVRGTHISLQLHSTMAKGDRFQPFLVPHQGFRIILPISPPFSPCCFATWQFSGFNNCLYQSPTRSELCTVAQQNCPLLSKGVVTHGDTTPRPDLPTSALENAHTGSGISFLRPRGNLFVFVVKPCPLSCFLLPTSYSYSFLQHCKEYGLNHLL